MSPLHSFFPFTRVCHSGVCVSLVVMGTVMGTVMDTDHFNPLVHTEEVHLSDIDGFFTVTRRTVITERDPDMVYRYTIHRVILIGESLDSLIQSSSDTTYQIFSQDAYDRAHDYIQYNLPMEPEYECEGIHVDSSTPCMGCGSCGRFGSPNEPFDPELYGLERYDEGDEIDEDDPPLEDDEDEGIYSDEDEWVWEPPYLRTGDGEDPSDSGYGGFSTCRALSWSIPHPWHQRGRLDL
nr:hypothetical protein [Salmonid herpesvirus 1]